MNINDILNILPSSIKYKDGDTVCRATLHISHTTTWIAYYAMPTTLVSDIKYHYVCKGKNLEKVLLKLMMELIKAGKMKFITYDE